MQQYDQTMAWLTDHGQPFIDLAQTVHAHPELGFAEVFAHEQLCNILEQNGFVVERSYLGVETAFRASWWSSGPTVAFLCEFDALPEIGHACGHNIIAGAGAAAGVVAKHLLGEGEGRLEVIGTPAEEGGGGKIVLMERGAFAHVDAALMVHPADRDQPTMHAIAIQPLRVRFVGQEAHAAAFPEQGRNALDAAVFAYNAIAGLRQHMPDTARIHGVFTKGGEKPNIVPALTEMEWYVRAASLPELDALLERVVQCFTAGALAAGCEMTYEKVGRAYSDLVPNGPLLERYLAYSDQSGRVMVPFDEMPPVMGSTDMGNVSYAVPSLHPMIKIAPAGTAIHTVDFAQAAASPAAHRSMLEAAALMACTGLDVLEDPALLAAMKTFHFGLSASHPH